MKRWTLLALALLLGLLLICCGGCATRELTTAVTATRELAAKLIDLQDAQAKLLVAKVTGDEQATAELAVTVDTLKGEVATLHDAQEQAIDSAATAQKHTVDTVAATVSNVVNWILGIYGVGGLGLLGLAGAAYRRKLLNGARS